MKKIAFIATSYITTADGISVYLENLFKAILTYENLFVDLYISKSSYEVFLKRNVKDHFHTKINIIKIKDSNQAIKFFHLQSKLLLKKYDLILFPNPMPIFLTLSKRIKIIHDLTIKQTPKLFSIRFHIYINFLIYCMKYFDEKVGYISKQTKEDIINFYNIKEEKLLFLPNGIPYKVQNIKQPSNKDFYQKYNQNSLQFVVVGRINLSKGFDRILKFLNYLDTSNVNKDITLNIVGKQTNETKNIFKDAKYTNINIVFHGYIDDKKLNTLYKQSHFCLFLSRNEGYGLPLVEAMWLKSIPIVSKLPVFSEILGDEYPKFDDKTGYEEAIFNFIKEFLSNKTFQNKIHLNIEKAILLQKNGYLKSAKNIMEYIK